MNAIVPVTQDPKMLALIKRTMAKDCNDDEFNIFVNMARQLRLDPLRRQVYAFVFNKDDPKKRNMSIITAIDGFRTIAERTGNYRPDEDEPTYEIDSSLRSPLNPVGLVKAVVRVYKHSHGAWHRVTAEAYWEEFAPIKDEWVYDEASNKRKPSGKKTLDTSGNWGKMPRLMLAKVAEALALRKAWPDDFANVYVAEEIDKQAFVDLTPAEWVEEAAKAERQEKIGGPAIFIDWMNNKPVDRVPLGQFADKAMEFLEQSAEEPAAVKAWAELNVHSLREFWSHNATDALAIKKQIEAITAGLPAPAPAETAA